MAQNDACGGIRTAVASGRSAQDLTETRAFRFSPTVGGNDEYIATRRERGCASCHGRVRVGDRIIRVRKWAPGRYRSDPTPRRWRFVGTHHVCRAVFNDCVASDDHRKRCAVADRGHPAKAALMRWPDGVS